MANIISDETIEYVGILAKLELSGEEKEQVTNGDEREKILANAPSEKDGAFKVPKTVE